MKNLEKTLEEFFSPIIKRCVSEVMRNEKTDRKNSLSQKKSGRIDLAMQVTGLAKQTIYEKARKGEIPSIKKGGTRYFNTEALEKWMESGNTNSKSSSNDK